MLLPDFANHPSKFHRRIMILLAIMTLVAGWIYGRVSYKTPVERYLPEAYPSADQFELIFSDTDQMLYLFNGKDGDGNSIGFVTITEGQGYGGPMFVVTGWSQQGSIGSVHVPKHNEDAPWFRLLENRKFFDQYVSKKDTDPLRLGKDLDAVTGATRSAHGVAEGVLRGRKLVAKSLGHPIPAGAPLTIQLGLTELLLLLGFGFTIVLRRIPVLAKIKWRRSLTLAFGFIVFGLWVQQPLSLVHFATWMIGYAPEWRNNLFLYGLVFGVLFLVVYLGQNFYCFWLCPFSAVQEAAQVLTGSKIRASETCDRALRNARYVLLWLALLLAFLFHNPSITIYEPWTALFTLKGSTEQWFLVGFTLIAAMFVHNFWCYYLCPVGALLEIVRQMRHRVVTLFRGRQC